jgi:hypothetical protein
VRTILVAASLAMCAVGCSTTAPPEASASSPQQSTPPGREVPERSATVVSATKFDDQWTYVLAHDDNAPTVPGYVTVRSAGGEVFAARVSPAHRLIAERYADADAPRRQIAELDPLPDGDPLPALSIGERLMYVPLGEIPGFDRRRPQRGASDVPPFGR